MRKAAPLMLIAVSVAACAARDPSQIYSAPAPEGALSCSLRTLSGLGYTPVRGGVSDGFVVFTRTANYSAAERAAAVLPGVGKKPTYDQLTVTGAGSALRVAAVGLDAERNPKMGPSPEGRGHAQSVMTACANPSDQYSRPSQ